MQNFVVTGRSCMACRIELFRLDTTDLHDTTGVLPSFKRAGYVGLRPYVQKENAFGLCHGSPGQFARLATRWLIFLVHS